MASRPLLLGLALAALLMGGGAIAADTSEVDQLREQLRATVLQLRQLQDQQAVTAQPSTPPPTGDDAKKLAAARANLRVAKQKAADLQTALDKAKADNEALTAASAANAVELRKVKAALGEADDLGRGLTVERDGLKGQLARATNIAAACQAKNDRLTAFAESMLAAYRKLTFGGSLAAREPFLGLKRVELENIAQNREDAVRAEHCDARLDASPPAKPAVVRGALRGTQEPGGRGEAGAQGTF